MVPYIYRERGRDYHFLRVKYSVKPPLTRTAHKGQHILMITLILKVIAIVIRVVVIMITVILIVMIMVILIVVRVVVVSLIIIIVIVIVVAAAERRMPQGTSFHS